MGKKTRANKKTSRTVPLLAIWQAFLAFHLYWISVQGHNLISVQEWHNGIILGKWNILTTFSKVEMWSPTCICHSGQPRVRLLGLSGPKPAALWRCTVVVRMKRRQSVWRLFMRTLLQNTEMIFMVKSYIVSNTNWDTELQFTHEMDMTASKQTVQLPHKYTLFSVCTLFHWFINGSRTLILSPPVLLSKSSRRHQ